MKSKYLVLALLMVFLCSCSSDSAEIPDPKTTEKPKEPEEPETPEEDIWNVNKSDQYAVNIIFYKPSDFNATDDVINKISDMALYIQKWYEVQMELNGYGEKTFGLITNQHGKVRVHVIESSNPSSYYHDKEEQDPYSTLQELNAAVNNYFGSNAGFKASAHSLILSNEETLIRFVGSGKNAYARSSNFSLEPTGKYFGDFELMKSAGLGGIMHELAHGLNVPHNCHKNSELPKISLMSFGNHTYENGQEDMVFMTKTTAAILNVNEAFNKINNGIVYYSQDSMEMQMLEIEKNDANNSIDVQGIISSDTTPTHLYISNDGAPSGQANNNYDDVTFVTGFTDLGDNRYSFSVKMPYQELFNNYKDEFKNDMLLSIKGLTIQGNRHELYKYNYTIDLSTKTPNDDVNKTYEIFTFSDRSSWTITANTTSPNSARNIVTTLDGDLSSYWHSNYPYDISTNGNHELTIDMGTENKFNGIYLHSDRGGINFRPKHVIVQESADGNTYVEVKEFDLENIPENQLSFDTPITTRYLKILVSEVHISSGSEENLILNEIDFIY
ncbi:discoidin domain-containing protein [Flagellimonas pacifica]|uniref:F5/8 type C domain-containing protein n=1 Tax=Flagellimonas pacifica TaxID=1247520 RepID=A0A285MXB1_9FLAO|nr:discoidin domain-containing protein [Allomuricauda parva]SNZ00456.1 F5/8 type C domain-containing protein [Allomuricauda parva]